MFHILLSIAAICFSSFVAIYGLYFLLVLKTSKKKEYLKLIQEALEKELPLEQLPNVSILIPAFDEEKAVSRKIEDIAALDYPIGKIEVILIDDCSTDRTAMIAQRMFKELNLPGKIVKNSKRMGVNASYNRGVSESKGNLILTTDVDVTIDCDALKKGVKVLKHLKNIGGITGKSVPVSNDVTAAVSIEKSYRSLFNEMLTSESALYSTFPGYTAFTLLRKSAFSPLPSYGSSDGNISLTTIRKGLKFLYVPNILFYEPISYRIEEQRRQKVRRAARLIQATLANKDMLFQGKWESFGKIIFPLRFAMMIISPILLLTGSTAMLLATVFASVTIASVLVSLLIFSIYLGFKIHVPKLNFFNSFIMHQYYLLIGLYSSRRKIEAWRPPKRSEMTV